MTDPENPLLAPWQGPHGGVPPFNQMDLGLLKPAVEEAIRCALQEFDEIASRDSEPTFENTILAIELAGRDLQRVLTCYQIWSGSLSSPEFRKIQLEIVPLLSDYNSKRIQNAALFQRVKSIRESDQSNALEPDQRRLLKLTYDNFARNGATLTGKARERYAAINKQLAEAQTAFGNNVMADEEGYVVYLSANQLNGLPAAFIEGAAETANERGEEGRYAVTNTRSSMEPFLTFSDDRAARETVWRNYTSRGNNGDDHDNNALAQEILTLRHERVQLLGYKDYATWKLEDCMAATPETAFDLMRQVWQASTARVAEEVADMQAIADRQAEDVTIEPWDYRYFAEKVRQAKYDLDSDAVKQYLQMDNLRDAMFMVARELFGYKFSEVDEGSVPVFEESVKVWEVTDVASGDHIGLWYLDPFARPGKRSGAWASMYRVHKTFEGKETVLASNNLNFVKGKPGEPMLVSWTDAITMFHEFGHSLHFLSANVTYAGLNSGVRDYTELQSQLLERWLSTDRVIAGYLVHVDTGEPMPDELVAKIKAAATFNQGFETTEFLACALMDMIYHTTDPTDIDPQAFEQETLERLGMPKEIAMRHRTTQFSHIFNSEGYAAGYYGYMWADVLTADAAEAFAEAPDGFYDKELATRLIDLLYAPRNAVDPAEAWREFRGRDPQMEALMRDRGFPLADE